MKVALIGDVHANLPALEAVLADARSREAQAVWNLGDCVGYGPHPEQVVQRLRAGALLRRHSAAGTAGRVPSILGNYDRKVLAFERNKGKWRHSKAPEKYLAFRWTHQSLSPDSLAYLGSLPEQIRLEVGRLRVLLTHGSPAADDEHLRADTAQGRFEELARRADADVVCCAHSHKAFARRAAGVWFVNPGSVGRPEGGDPRACYGLLAFRRSGLAVDLRRVAYDVERVARAIRSAGLPEDFARMLLRGRNLDEVGGVRRGGSEAPSARRVRPTDAECIEAALALARSCRYEREHTHQVTRLALDLFDQLQPLHKLGQEERFLLHCGALLHDIGWADAPEAHHKTALRIILGSSLPLEGADRLIVASIARYHRKALPSEGHRHFARLSPQDRRRVRVLAAILRVADALDRSHLNLVSRLTCQVLPDGIVVRCDVAGPAGAEESAAAKKADLLRQVFGRELIVETIPT